MNNAVSKNATDHWTDIYNRTPLCEVPRHYAGLRQSPFMMQYLQTVLGLCPEGGRVLEAGSGSGYSAVWLSRRGCLSEGIDLSPELVERALQINNMLEGKASFSIGDVFSLYEKNRLNTDEPIAKALYHVIHHQGVLEHFTVPQIHAILAQQVALARHVVFSVPSVHYPFDPEFGNERLLPLEEWQRILEPFDIAELKLYGDPQHGEREHVLCVLRGQTVTPELLALMEVPAQPYLPGITAIVHSRNEAARIEECLKSLQGWTDEIIVCDMESSDATLEIAGRYTDQIIHHPHIAHFDRARNVSAMRAKHRWIFYLDADERVPPRLGPALRSLAQQQEEQSEADEAFDALLIPFRHHFAGHWLRCLYPGYTMPRLFKNGRFHFNARLHAGPSVEGKTAFFPADDPELALVHYSYDSLGHYLDKLNRYTDGESLSMYRDGHSFSWQNAIRHWVTDFQSYYDHRNARRDGVHGLLYSFLSGFYRFEQHAKLYERRFHAGQLQPGEMAVPQSVEELLEYALSVLREKPLPQATPVQVHSSPAQLDCAVPSQDAAQTDTSYEEGGEMSGHISLTPIKTGFNLSDASSTEISSPAAGQELSVLWSAPLQDPSGYGEESRQFVFGLNEIQQEPEQEALSLATQILPWSHDTVTLTEEEHQTLAELSATSLPSGFIHITQNFPMGIRPHPQAGLSIGRTMFETDRLPQDWVHACNRLDYIWVPSQWNRQTFIDAGVEPSKLAVIPGCLDAASYQESESQKAKRLERGKRQASKSDPFTFLSVFDWTRHKGWDVLLSAFLRAFENRDDVSLVLKVWSTMGYSNTDIQQQAAQHVQSQLHRDLRSDPRIRFIHERLPAEQLRTLFQNSDAYVMPSRGEGWGRPYMEAMACGLPTIGTDWSGNTAFMNPENSYLIRNEVVAIPEIGWREIPTYRGHRWAEPDEEHLMDVMRRVVDQRDEALQVAERGREEILERFDRRRVARLMLDELQRIRDISHATPIEQPPTANESLITNEQNTPLRVRWEGAQFSRHSLGLVNREICLQLAATSEVDLSLVPNESAWFSPREEPRFAALEERCFHPLAAPADVHVRHFFPPRLQKPAEGHFVLMQPWEYGYLPAAWIEPIQHNVDEVWCYSEYIRQVYVDSGIAADKLHIIPLGVDTEVFRPTAPPYIFTVEPGGEALMTRKPFTFLFTGGTIDRKGIDILLQAYSQAFTALDEVCLVIKDTGADTVYRGGNMREHILQLIEEQKAQPNRAPIVYLDSELSSAQLAGLYTASDCLVQPYRGEGFCLPALEAMACGVPVIVPEGGATDDFIDESVGWRLPAEKKSFANLPIGPAGEMRGRIGQWDCCGETWMLEIDPRDLAKTLRHIAQHPEEARAKGAAAAARVQDKWTWENTAQSIQTRLKALQQQPIPTECVVENECVPIETAESTRTRAKISLCMIARDEERVFDECLESIKPYVDEMIVVDTGSVDRTAEIAARHGAQVFHFPWCDDFSAARNESIKHATGDWILWMDADDTIPAQCGEKLRELADLAEKETTGYIMQVHIPPAPGEQGFTIVDHVKLFRNDARLRFEGRIHEQILEPIHRIGGKVERSDLYVVHSGYDYSPEGQQKKRRRDLTLLQKDLDERPGHPFVLFNIGMTAHHLKEWDKAIEALEECLKRSKPFESTVRKTYAMLAGSCLGKDDVDGALKWLEKGLALFPHDPELLFRAGIIYREAGNLRRAEESYLTLLTHREVGHIDSLDVSMTGFKAHHNLALIYQDMDKLPESEKHFRQAVQHNPNFLPSWHGLAEVLRRNGRNDEFNAVTRHIDSLTATN